MEVSGTCEPCHQLSQRLVDPLVPQSIRIIGGNINYGLRQLISAPVIPGEIGSRGHQERPERRIVCNRHVRWMSHHKCPTKLQARAHTISQPPAPTYSVAGDGN